MEISISIEELRKRKLFVATPCYGGQCFGLYTKACLDLQGACIAHGIPVTFSFVFNESLITRARNYLVDEFLRTDCTHMLFIDADIQFNPQDILALLAIDRDIIGAPYPKKSINWSNIMKGVLRNKDNKDFNPGELDNITGDYVFNLVPGVERFQIHEPVEVMEIGTGYMMIKREVFDHYKEEFPHLNYRPDHIGQENFDGSRYIHAYFDTIIDPKSHRYLSEDYMFCQNAREIGYKVWLCPWMKTVHVGTYAFRGDLNAVATISGDLR